MSNDIVVIDDEPLSNTELENDLTFAREKQLDIINHGHKSLKGLLLVADQSQQARAYEVLSMYLKTLSELNKDFITIAERKSFTKDEETKEDAPSVTNQLFVGSTAELAAMLRGTKSNNE